ncbi:Spo0B domain-containing protein [Paenibacillus koleovorans]|uniref:Spo0B domain-containing protein n=1 Tax=Paenibacillus koleovorans TaxID=121608 RepID=UPI000FDB6936|nr:Spo0B domain-containing protein [Paenibacillus koleovorans]
MNRKEQAISESDCRRELQAKDELLVDLVSHMRHDWMNDIQVLHGYLRLNKHDKLLAFMDTIRQKAARDSLITKLGVTELVVYLLTFRLKCPTIELEVELEPEFALLALPVQTKAVAGLAMTVLECIKAHANESRDGGLHHVQMEWTRGEEDEEELTLIFDLNGDFDMQPLEHAIEQVCDEAGREMPVLQASEYGERWASVTIHFPYIRE